MKRIEALTVAVRDVLQINPLYNSSVPAFLRIVPNAIVMDVRHTRGCQTGVMLKVTQQDNNAVWLDAGWFQSKIGDQGKLL